VNRVSTATATSGVWNNLTLSWTYDSFGNRKTQTPSGQNIVAPVPQAQTLSYPSQNRISNYGVNGYDAAGNVLYDQINNYLYDAEGRLCAVSYFNGMTTEYMLYLYDGEGRRVAKVSNPTFSCTPASTGSTLQETYLLGPSGEHITELGQAGAFLRSNVYANGQLLATYTNNGTYFPLNDWLGSKRVVAKYDGTKAQMCMNLPFGDDLMCSATDLSEHHFTGQIYDQETKNDYFNARYYSNNTGRFLTPDWSSAPDTVPYADFNDPQSLNLYAYVNNSPLSLADPDGHGCFDNDAASSTNANGDLVVNGNCNWGDFLPSQQQVNQVVDPVKNAVQQVQDFIAAPRDQACMSAATNGGMATGAAGGAAWGMLGLATGPGEAVIEPTAILGGATFGGASGFAMGLSACKTGSGGGSTGSAGSTGRGPSNLKEQLAIEQAKSNPKAGTVIPLKGGMKDPTWPGSQGWVKMRQNINGVEVHYVRNTITDAVDDFKIK
jgi:RHS repeat-associated protein